MSDSPGSHAVLLLGNYRPTLTIARQLARKGATVIVGREGCDRGAELSRYVTTIWDHPPISDDPNAFISALEALIEQVPHIQLVVPVAEEFIRLLAERPPVFNRPVTVATMDRDLLNICLDKYRMMQLAEKLGIPIAPHALAHDRNDLEQQAIKVGFPMVVRPLVSTQRIGDEKALTVRTMADLLERFSDWHQDRGSLILQRQAGGQRHNIYFAARNGDIRRLLQTRITRTDRPDGSGLAVEGTTVNPSDDLVSYVRILAEHLAYDGIGCAQFLVDDATGTVCFLENNPRITGSHAIPEHCGLDLTEFLIALAEGREDALEPRPFASGGVAYSWSVGDFIGWKSAVRRRKVGVFEALQWLASIPLTALRSRIDMVNRWDDPLPGIGSLVDAIPVIGHLTQRRHRPRKGAWTAPLGPATSGLSGIRHQALKAPAVLAKSGHNDV